MTERQESAWYEDQLQKSFAEIERMRRMATPIWIFDQSKMTEEDLAEMRKPGSFTLVNTGPDTVYVSVTDAGAWGGWQIVPAPKPRRELTEDDKAVHRAIGFGTDQGGFRQMGGFPWMAD